LIQQLDQSNLEKDCELKLTLNDLQSQHKGVQETVKFTNELLISGNHLELALSKEPIINKINDLMKQDPLDMRKPSDIIQISFIALNKLSIIKSIHQFGFINKGKTILSPLHSSIQNINQGQSIHFIFNKPSSFLVNLKDREGITVKNETRRLKLNINGPSKNRMVRYM